MADSGLAFYDAQGNRYSGNSQFAFALIDALNELKSKKYGGALVKYLMNRKEGIYVQESTSDNSTKGLTVNWNPSQSEGGLSESNDKKRPSYIGLAHEFGHIMDKFNNPTKDVSEDIWLKARNSCNENISNSEKFATTWENLIRAEHSLPLRMSYLSDDNDYYGSSQIVDSKTRRNLFFHIVDFHFENMNKIYDSIVFLKR